MLGKYSPSFGPIILKSLGGSGIGSLSKHDRLIANADRGVPGNLDGVLYALVRRAALGMELERALSCLARLRGHGQVVMDVNRFDADRLADPRDAAVDGGLEGVPIERDFAPCQGATQRAVHSAGDGGHDTDERRGDWGPFLGPIVLAERPLDAVDDGFGDLTEIRVPVASRYSRRACEMYSKSSAMADPP